MGAVAQADRGRSPADLLDRDDVAAQRRQLVARDPGGLGRNGREGARGGRHGSAIFPAEKEDALGVGPLVLKPADPADLDELLDADAYEAQLPLDDDE